MKHILITLFSFFMTLAASAQTTTWAEGTTMQLTAATSIQYGAASTWATKPVGPGAVACSNATFGDPIPGTVKSCRIKPRFNCLPSPVGTGTSFLAKSGVKGDLLAWYCPGDEFPHLFVCLKSTCSLVGSKRAFAALISNPTLAGLEVAMAPYQRDVYTDPELVAVWLPYASEIRALAAE